MVISSAASFFSFLLLLVIYGYVKAFHLAVGSDDPKLGSDPKIQSEIRKIRSATFDSRHSAEMWHPKMKPAKKAPT
ncbi:hypothetical protein L596_009861 [Steinernema carpocapsae]|uniref:Uncharacterized protein n=1 Tax=Steinernema carpocapsae TaxID=34508 RepID=A0A4U5PH33_STECR|nr:hypothetical protein L596_009861 [Steinernema carpocapsae]